MSHYKIQTIPHNLSKEETIVQMVEILDHLDAITQDAFSRVSKRLEENNAKLSSISKRIDAASTKVTNLKGDKKAKTVFSSSKYPATDINRDYVSIFKEPVTVERVRHEVPHGKRVSTFEPVSKLQFYHVKVPEMNNNQVPEGLGDVPSDINCVNDLLLFNTGKNVYKDFKPDGYCKNPTIIRPKDNYTTSELGAAPVSISQRSSMQQANKDSYFYTPKIEELPALDVPWDLPNLPGIADDVRYEIEGSGDAISPSAVRSSQVVDVDLPDISTFTAAEVSLPPPPPPLINIPLPPPIEQMLVAPEKTPQPDEPPSVPQPPVHMAPPPPVHMEPPPPPPVPTLQTDSRASLMDAIRKAGGSKVLRKTNEQSQASAPKGGDLMADLHLKLQMRRKGISGSKQTDQGHLGGADSAFARMSSIIPPPAKSSDVGSSVSTDDDDDAWNDDDDD